MRNIQVIDGADNAMYDIFAATEDKFALIFPAGQDVAFIDEVIARTPVAALDHAFAAIGSAELRRPKQKGSTAFFSTRCLKRSSTTRQEGMKLRSTQMAHASADPRPNPSLQLVATPSR